MSLKDTLLSMADDLGRTSQAGDPHLLADHAIQISYGCVTDDQLRALIAVLGTPMRQEREAWAGEHLTRVVTDLVWSRPWGHIVATLDRRLGPLKDPWGEPLREGWDS